MDGVAARGLVNGRMKKRPDKIARLLFKADAAEEFRTMEHRLFKVDRTPAQEMRFGKEVAAFIEIGGHFLALEGVYLMDEQG